MIVIFRVDDVDSRLGFVIMSALDRIVQLTDALAVEIRRRQQLETENAALRAHVVTTRTTPDVALENQALRAGVADQWPFPKFTVISTSPMVVLFL